MNRPTSFGIGRFQDKRKAELCRLLEIANIRLADTRDLIRQIYDPSSAEQISNRVYRLQEQISELKRLVKQ
jgi:ribosome recycling factor